MRKIISELKTAWKKEANLIINEGKRNHIPSNAVQMKKL